MIVILQEGKVVIKDTQLLECTDRVYIEYVYEKGTDHLLPRLTITKKGLYKNEWTGDHTYIDVSDIKADVVTLKVELLDAKYRVIRSYISDIPFNKYVVFGNKPVRPDVEAYIRSMQTHIAELLQEHQLEIERLNQVIKELEEKGEVI